MRIAEIYQSLQGEGLLTGTPSVFVRASGCNLRCGFCDTPFTSWDPEGDDLALDEITDAVSRLSARHVVITGGEPMLFAEMIPLTEHLHRHGYHITIETAGTLFLPLQCDLMSLSPKLANSAPDRTRFPQWYERHERTRHAPDVVRKLIELCDYQIKFVVASYSDCEEVDRYLGEFPEIRRERVLLMPEGTDPKVLDERAGWLEPLCKDRGYVFCPRKHIEWYGMTRGT